ncbi:TIGR02680 family protein [Haliovirga abyssi]|uniref:TIGR02680 family protein n=1 Tax=Haliovirga abyssi TaxID=2996794 RepID=A0AAU9DN40_9FUSO|nr:TIGR02680 family protein [Haliovirga abyssi]BDU51477.1 TIGR02680 family protein [Haliovirga abyssi]
MNRWQIKRFGLINFWYYDDEEFTLEDGKLLLRGSNGSGKSVTMQSFIPLLLDGSVRPERLDPFGSRARRIDSYILPEGTEYDENTGYLYMELKKKTGEYISFGMGIRAKRGTATRTWYFCIDDGRRIGRDFYLYKEKVNKVPLSKMELKNAIGNGGTVVDKQSDYVAMVNRYIFGFETVKEYEDLVNLLINLRSPKLSKNFKPSATYEILKGSLEPISDDELRPLTEAVENMDELQDNLKSLKNAKRESEKIKRAYDKYNSYILLKKLNKYIQAKENLDKNISELKRTEKYILNINNQKNESITKRDKLEAEKESINHLIETYEKSEFYQLQKEILDIKSYVKEKKEDFETENRRLERREEDRNIKYSEINSLKNDKEVLYSQLNSLIDENRERANEINFSEDINFRKEFFSKLDKDYNFELLKKETDIFKDFFRNGKIIIENYKKSCEEYDKIVKIVDDLKDELRKIEEEIVNEEKKSDNSKEIYLEKLEKYASETKELNFQEKDLEDIIIAVNSCDEKKYILDIKYKYKNIFNRCSNNIEKEVIENRFHIENLNEKIQEKSDEIDEWKSKKDPIYEIEEKEKKYCKKLDSLKIKYDMFWKTVDFRENISEETKGIIEEILIDTNIISSIILFDNEMPKLDIEEGIKLLKTYNKNRDDKNISEENRENKNLFNYLKVEAKYNEEEKEYIEKILKSIPVNQKSGEFFIGIEGKYSYGPIEGKTTKINKAKFIGISARENYKKELIKLLEEKIESLNLEKAKIEEKLSNLKNRKEMLKKEFENIPDFIQIEEIMENINILKREKQMKFYQIEEKEKEELIARQRKNSLNEKVNELRVRTKINLDLESFTEALDLIEKYRYNILEIENKYKRFLDFGQRIDRLIENIENVEDEIEDIKLNLNKIKKALDTQKQILEELEKRAEQEGIENLVEQLAQLKEKRKENEKNFNETIMRISSIESEIKNLKENLIKIEQESENLKELESSWKKGLYEEVNLAYVVNELDISNKSELKALSQRLSGNIDIDKGIEYSNDLNNKFLISKNYLSDYRLNMEYRFNEPINGVINEVLGELKRVDVIGKIRGEKTNLIHILSDIEENILRDEKLLADKERELFEEILIKTISKRITEKIEKSEIWVFNMNKLMESMNTNTIRLGLSWAGRKPDNEEQMNSSELVKLLRKDEFTRRTEDITKIVSHFKSKIAEAKKEMEKEDNIKSFHTIMKELLDYREWYEFKLSVKRGEGLKKQLTQNEFYKFSGGEKAMTMYVPLFAAVSARYDNASKDAPKIISLDEAFAGVDERNISVMFEFMVNMKFDFIVNSQVLWGDYGTIPNLAIAELYRPNNSDVVTVFRYKWNGNKRTAVVGKELYDNKSGNMKMF